MTLNQYAEWTLKPARYPEAGTRSFLEVNYLVVGLSAEAGEVLGKWSKVLRDAVPRDEFVRQVEPELGDVLWYWARLCEALGLNPKQVMSDNYNKLNDRMRRGTIGGSGDNR